MPHCDAGMAQSRRSIAAGYRPEAYATLRLVNAALFRPNHLEVFPVRRVWQCANDPPQLFPIDKSPFPHSDLKGQHVLSSAFVKQVLDGLRGE